VVAAIKPTVWMAATLSAILMHTIDIRLTGALARILNLKAGRFGCANARVGGSQGVAAKIEREKYV
jgi:hypothetical protein